MKPSQRGDNPPHWGLPMDAAFTDACRGGDSSERLLYVLFDAIGDFLAACSYTECHRTHVLNLLG